MFTRNSYSVPMWKFLKLILLFIKLYCPPRSYYGLILKGVLFTHIQFQRLLIHIILSYHFFLNKIYLLFKVIVRVSIKRVSMVK